MHLNALKTYVDMKFDVLKGMMDKTLARSSEGAAELGEDDDMMVGDGKLDDLESTLQESMSQMSN